MLNTPFNTILYVFTKKYYLSAENIYNFYETIVMSAAGIWCYSLSEGTGYQITPNLQSPMLREVAIGLCYNLLGATD